MHSRYKRNWPLSTDYEKKFTRVVKIYLANDVCKDKERSWLSKNGIFIYY